MINYLSFLMILTLSECTELRSLATRSSYTTTYYGSGYSPSSFGSSGSSYRASNSYGYTGYNFNSAGNNFNYNSNTFSKNSFARYQSTANQAVRTNSYFSNGKTYKPLTSYYLPQDYFNSKGYYSDVYTVTYYDGYGYNFFYGDYDYYEFSVNDAPLGGVSPGVVATITFSVMFSCFICMTCFIFKDQLGGPCKDCCGGLCNIC